MLPPVPRSPTHLEDLLKLVRRELGATRAWIDEDEAQVLGSTKRLRSSLSPGRWLAVEFDSPPEDAEARLRRLEMLASSFQQSLEP